MVSQFVAVPVSSIMPHCRRATTTWNAWPAVLWKAAMGPFSPNIVLAASNVPAAWTAPALWIFRHVPPSVPPINWVTNVTFVVMTRTPPNRSNVAVCPPLNRMAFAPTPATVTPVRVMVAISCKPMKQWFPGPRVPAMFMDHHCSWLWLPSLWPDNLKRESEKETMNERWDEWKREKELLSFFYTTHLFAFLVHSSTMAASAVAMTPKVWKTYNLSLLKNFVFFLPEVDSMLN